MKSKFTYQFFLICSILFFGQNMQAQNCDPTCELWCAATQVCINLCSACDNVIAADNCADAATPTICELDGFESTTCGFSPDGPNAFTAGFCGGGTGIHNNMWIGFTPLQSGILQLEIEVPQCLGQPNPTCPPRGLQAALARATCTNPGNVFQAYETLACVNGVTTDFNLNTVEAIAGVPHYIMIDGFCGDVCDFKINVIAGLPDPGWELEGLSGTLCPDILNPECLSPQSTATVLATPNSDADPNATLIFTWYDPDGVIIYEGQGFNLGSQQQSTLFGVNPNTGEPYFCKPGNYTVTVRDLTTCCEDEDELELFVDVPPEAEAIFALAEEASFNCNINQVTMIGGATDSSVDILFQNWSKVDWGSYPPDKDQLPNSYLPGGQNTNTVEIILEDDPSGAGVYVYQFVERGQLTCPSETLICVPADTIKPMIDIDDPAELDCGTNPTVTLDATDSEVFNVEMDCTVGDIQAGEYPQEELVLTTNFTVQWTSDDGYSIVDDQTLTPTVSNSGWYEVMITNNDNGCVNTQRIFVPGQVDPPIIDAIPDETLDCNNTFTIDVSGVHTNAANTTYTWTDSQGNTVGTGTMITVTDADTYTLTVVNTDNQCLAQESFIVDQNNDTPAIDPLSGPDLTCTDTESLVDATITGSDDYTYSWVDGNGVELADTEDYTVVTAGTYTLIVTDNVSGCSADATVTIAVNGDVPVVDPMPELVLNCINSETVTQTAVATDPTGANNLQYEWFDANNMSVGTGTDLTITTEGLYTVIVRNPDNGCETPANVNVVLDNDPPTPDPGMPQILTCTNNETVELDGSGSTGAGTLSYDWSGPGGAAGTSATLTATVAGTYTLVITDASNGCTEDATVEVTADVMAPTPDAGMDQVLTCDNLQEVMLDGSGSTGAGTLSYDWSGPGGAAGTSATLTATTPGVYTLLITDDANGCTETTTVEVTEDIAAPDVTPSGPVTLTCTDNSGLDISATSNTPGVTYSWERSGFPEGTTPTLTVTSAGLYMVTVTNPANGCTSTASVEVSNSDSQPTILITTDPNDRQLDCNITSYELSASNSNTNVTNVTYVWQDANGNVLTGNPVTITEPGDYTVVATNEDNGCTSESNAAFIQNIVEPDIVLNGDLITCAESSVEIIAADLNDITTTSTGFSWTGPNGFTSPLSNPMVNEPGIYTVVAVGGNGCTSSETIEIMSDTADPQADAAADFTLTCNQDNYDLGGSSDGANNVFEWNGPGGYTSSDASPNITGAGLYILTVTNPDNGCEATTEVNIDADFDEPTAIVPGDLTIDCNADNADIMGDTDINDGNYSWMLPDGTVVDNQMINATLGGVYTLTVTDESNGCSMTQTIMVTEDFDAPTAIAEGGETTCADPNINLQADTDTPGVTYQWSGPGGFTSTEENPSASAGGDYTLLITAPNGCTATDLATITADENIPEVTPMIVDAAVINCDVDMVELVAEGNIPNGVYTWVLPDGSTQTGSTILAGEAGNYEVMIFNPDNGCEGLGAVSVTDDFNPPTIETNDGIVTCLAPETSLDGSSTTPNAEYEWTGPNGFSSMEQNPMTMVGGTYILVVTDPSNGCTSQTDLVIAVDQDNPDISADFETVSELDCNNMMLGIIGDSNTDGVEFLWTGPNGFSSTNPNENIDADGEYTLTITNPDNSCVSTETITVTADFEMPVLNTTGNLITCQELTVDVMASSDENIDSFAWTGPDGYTSDQQNPDDITLEGDYTVVITAADNGCTNSELVTVEIDQGFPAVSADGDEINCSAPETTLTGAGSAEGATITYEWTLNGSVVSTELNAMVDAAGVYTLTVFDSSNGCEQSMDYEVIDDFLDPVADAGMDAELSCIETEEMASAAGSSGQGALTYEWTNSAGAVVGTAETLVTSEVGIFTLTVTDTDNGCQATDQVEITPDANAPDIVVPAAETITCDVPSVTLDASASVSQGPLDYEWLDVNGNQIGTGATVDVTASGTYTIVLVDQSNGCDAEMTISVPENLEQPQFAFEPVDPINCTTNSTIIDLTVTSADNPDFSWSGPGGFTATSEDLNDVTSPGMYSVTVTDMSNGCVDNGQVAVDANEDYPIVQANVDDELDCTTEEVELDGTGSTPGLDYTWSTDDGVILQGATTLNPTVSQAGTYTLTVLDEDNGCEDSADVMVLRNETVIDDLDVDANDANCFGPNTGSITIEAIGGTEPFLYSIDGGNSFSTQVEYLGLSAGTYPIVVEDDLGCLYDTEVTVGPAIELDLELTSSVSNTDNVANFGDEITLFPETNFDIDNAVWSDSTLVGINPTDTMFNTTTYTVITYDENGCQKEDNITIFVKKIRPIYIPSAFSPNNDGINDGFTVFAKENLVKEILSLDVYDRWGGHMFHNEKFQPNNESLGWQGNHPRQDEGTTYLQPGVFVYYAVVEFIDGEVILYEGDVTIMR